MAKSAKEGASTGGVIKTIPKAELRSLVREATSAKEAAAEASGEHGAIVKNACERFGIEKNAFSWVRRLNDMEGPKRMAVIRQLLDFSSKLGFFDQIDAFDDVIPVLEQITADAKGKQAPEPDQSARSTKAKDRAAKDAANKVKAAGAGATPINGEGAGTH